MFFENEERNINNLSRLLVKSSLALSQPGRIIRIDIEGVCLWIVRQDKTSRLQALEDKKYLKRLTLPKPNMSPEKGPFEKEISCSNHQFLGDSKIFQGVYLITKPCTHIIYLQHPKLSLSIGWINAVACPTHWNIVRGIECHSTQAPIEISATCQKRSDVDRLISLRSLGRLIGKLVIWGPGGLGFRRLESETTRPKKHQ